MVVHQDGRLDAAEEQDRVFAALSDATRRDIVARVLRQEQSVTDLARGYPMSFAAVQRHVAVLERARLVAKVRHGRSQLVHPRVRAIRAAAALLDRYEQAWRERVDRIDSLLAEPAPPAERDMSCRSSAPPRTPRTSP